MKLPKCTDPERVREHVLGSDPASCHTCAMIASADLDPEKILDDCNSIIDEMLDLATEGE